ncbi:hypothetical protein AWC05_02585 [Mycobacterium florentinum]|uniref:Uncharacterized protein n=2 Tax=Mycobacterium florentinum TaxID=292462 RepID=A0A1X1TXG6_MYCFL|nr:hypothetical protein [Mycobacterium florentinum]MCV7413517.1 hypothetical protein [Mycobacterium florentinum]ORV49078.1 hypothetical protein AWC05_02585 [Mycobacterium florentinum]BBX77059.1 hypothetical protein MFLOJ_08460 [Mycobacterium florentinum]
MPRPKTRGCILVGAHDFPRGVAPGPSHHALPTFPIGGRREARTNRTTCNFNAATLSAISADGAAAAAKDF